MGQFADLYRKQQQQQQQQQGVSQPPLAPTGFNATYQDEEGSIYDEDLVLDRNFQKASKIAYEMNNSTEAELLNPEQYAKWGIEHMGWFNWNLPKMTLDASRITNATDEQKRAFLYMMDSYEDLGMSWKGTGRFFKGVLADPTTYIGLSTFGLGAVGGAAGKQATKQGIKELLKQSTRGGVIAGVEAGVYTAADDINRQVVETAVSGEDIDFGRVAKSGAIGVGAGFTLGTGLTALISRYGGKTTKQLAKDEVDEDKMLDGLLDEGDAPSGVPEEVASNPIDQELIDLEGSIIRIGHNILTNPKAKTIRLNLTKQLSPEELPRQIEKAEKLYNKALAKQLAEKNKLPSFELPAEKYINATTDAYNLLDELKRLQRTFNKKDKYAKRQVPRENAKTVYHATNAEFDTFVNREIGFHFAANPELAENAARLTGKQDATVKTFEINTEGFVEIPAQSNRFDYEEIVDHLIDTEKLSIKEAKEILDEIDDIEMRLTQDGFVDEVELSNVKGEYFAEAMANKNIRGFIYDNVYDAYGDASRFMDNPEVLKKLQSEGVQPDKSYIVLDPKNIKKVGSKVDSKVDNKVQPESPEGRLKSTIKDVVKAVKRSVPAGNVAALGLDGVQNMQELVKAVEPIKQLLMDASTGSPDEFADHLIRQGFTGGQSEFLEVATSQTVSALKLRVFRLRQQQVELDGDEAKAIQELIDELEGVITPLDELDVAMSRVNAQTMRARRKSLNTGKVRGETISSLEASGLSRSDAERQWDAIFSEKLIKKERDVEMKALDQKIEAARKSGDMSEYIKLRDAKKKKVAEFKEEVLREEGNPIYRAINKPINVINKIVIGFVFSPATLIVNLVPSVAKTLYKPALNNLMADGLTKKTYRQTMAEYSAMKANVGSAFKMAKAAWRYQRSGLTGDTARFLEDQAPLPDKFGGQVFGFFPRALLATDAFFENINYRGFAVGDATGRAYEEAAELVGKGKLKEDEVDGFIEKKVKEAVDNAYTADENAIDILEATAITKGLKGKKRENFILSELENNQELFIKATNDDGKDYVQDLLFKRDFSGQGAASQLARGYEQFVNKHPAMRLMGQLFFRTPVRVFEEGIRMTPMLNLVSPKFMRDLKGGKDVPKMRHIRAQGEAMMGYAIAGSVMSLYATGNITGSMGTNYKQTRQGENTGELEPYTIKFSDGSTFNYRNFDPFSTPIKIIVNALERAEMLAYREEQGENIDKTEMDKVQAWIAVATGSIATSIRDANLASGVDAVADLWEDLQEEDSDQLVKFVGRKAQMFLPNTYYKIQMLDDGFFGDPVTMEQFLRQRINPQDPKVPKRHSALGRIIENPNGWAGLLYFNTTTLEERKGDVPERVYDVEKHLYKLAQVGDTHFTAPYKFDKYFGGRDLRAIYTADGEETLYSRWMRYYYESGVVDVLHSQIGLPMGTASSVGIAEKAARKTINSFRKQAFMRLYAEEAGIQDRHMELLERRVRAKSGEPASDNIPYNIGN